MRGDTSTESSANSAADAVFLSESLKDFCINQAYVYELGQFNRTLKGEDYWATKGPLTVGDDTLYVMGVFDGHGGSRAASLCSERLIRYLLDAAGNDGSGESIRRAGTAAFTRCHEEVIALADGTATDGTTATVVVVNATRRELTTLNAGDSAAMLVPDTKAGEMLLSEDHRIATSEKERHRLLAMGGMLAHAVDRTGMPGGPLRLWPGGVAQARAIGDADVGKYIEPSPAVSTISLPEGGFSIVVCSDGVWDALPYGSISSLCRKSRQMSATRTAEALVTSAIQHCHTVDPHGNFVPRDDTTCCLLRYRSSELRARPPLSSTAPLPTCLPPFVSPRPPPLYPLSPPPSPASAPPLSPPCTTPLPPLHHPSPPPAPSLSPPAPSLSPSLTLNPPPPHPLSQSPLTTHPPPAPPRPPPPAATSFAVPFLASPLDFRRVAAAARSWTPHPTPLPRTQSARRQIWISPLTGPARTFRRSWSCMLHMDGGPASLDTGGPPS